MECNYKILAGFADNIGSRTLKIILPCCMLFNDGAIVSQTSMMNTWYKEEHLCSLKWNKNCGNTLF